METDFVASKENFYALALSTVQRFSSDKALSKMGLSKLINESQKASHQTKFSSEEKEKIRKMYR